MNKTTLLEIVLEEITCHGYLLAYEGSAIKVQIDNTSYFTTVTSCKNNIKSIYKMYDEFCRIRQICQL